MPLSAANIDLYARVRQKEGRFYSDDVAARLPNVPPSHPLRREWQARAVSAARLSAYLVTLPSPVWILDLGCGNGWLTNRLADLPGSRAVGVDLNFRELSQAARVFGGNAGVGFLCADISRAPFLNGGFDIVVLASAAQYFPDLPDLVREATPLLSARGEIHFIDSPFYAASRVEEARARSRAYYASLGFPEMAALYRHHTLDELAAYRPVLLHDPASPRARLRRLLRLPDSPFPWIRLSRKSVVDTKPAWG